MTTASLIHRYRWVTLAIVTLGVLMATIDSSIVLIALPDIFHGIGLDPLQPQNTYYLLWLILGFLVVTSVLVVSLGRLGDLYGRVRLYNAGFAVFTFFSLLLSITWMHGHAAALWLIVMRLFQALGAAMLTANSSAILTDAFPATQRGLAMGINQAASFSGSFIGLVLGGLLAPFEWRLIFIVSVPVGLVGTVWGYRSLREGGERHPAPIDWLGNVLFAVAMVLVLVGLTDGIEPYAGHAMGWTNPLVWWTVGVGLILFVLFTRLEGRVAEPMVRLELFRIRPFSAGIAASFLAALARGGLMFLLIIWLQGMWLPIHGYAFDRTPLWAGIAILPLTVGMLISGPLSGHLSDRYGARFFASGGMALTGVCFAGLAFLPVDFHYWVFAVILFLTGLSMAAFGSPNRAAVMSALPSRHRGAGSGINTTSQNAAQVLSIGLFFTLMVMGLSSGIGPHLYAGLVAHGVPAVEARHAASLSPISTLFSAFLGFNPVLHLVGPATLAHLSSAQRAGLLGRSFFPSVIAPSFKSGLHIALTFSVIMSFLAAATSWVRGPATTP